MPDLVVVPVNATYDKIACSDDIAQELYDLFTYQYPNYENLRYKVKRFRQSHWDGKVHLFTLKGHRIYRGLRNELQKFAQDRNYSIEYADDWLDDEFSVHEAESFIESLKLPFKPHDYQVNAFIRAIRKKRLLVLSPTSSGKSMMAYLIYRYWGKKTLFITPTVNLIQQLISHFKEYGYEGHIHSIYAGQEKYSDAPFCASTWQSLPLDPNYLNQYETIICDECHHASADILKKIMENATEVNKRLGFTATIQDTPLHELVLQGLFGQIYRTTTTSDLIQRGIVSDVIIKCLLLKYNEGESRYVKNLDYNEEIEYIVQHEKRKKFLYNLTLSLKGNTIILFRLVDKHGKIMYEDLKSLLPSDRPVYMIYGNTPAEEREEIRQLLSKNDNAVLVGSFGCVSHGLDAPSLQHVIFSSAYKSKIKILQSIGRGLRKYKDTHCVVYDIADSFQYKKHQNYTLLHFIERVKLYARENLSYKVYSIDIGESNNKNTEASRSI